MKKLFMTLFLASSLVISLAACAMASSSIYVGSMVGSGWKDKNNAGFSDDGDLSGLLINADLSTDLFNMGIEYTNGTKKAPDGDIDFNTMYIRGGIYNVKNDQGYSAINVGYYQSGFDDGFNTKITGIMFGMDSLGYFGEKSRLDFSWACSFIGGGEYKSDSSSDRDVLILMAHIKYSYFLTDNLGISVGYRYNQYKLDDSDKTKFTFSGPTAGLTYRF